MKRLIFNESQLQDDDTWEEQTWDTEAMEILEMVKKDFEELGFEISLRDVSNYWDLYSDHLCASFLSYANTLHHYLYYLEGEDTYKIEDNDNDLLLRIEYRYGKYPMNIKIIKDIDDKIEIDNIIEEKDSNGNTEFVIYTYDRHKSMDILIRNYYEYCDNIFTFDKIKDIHKEIAKIYNIDISLSIIKLIIIVCRDLMNFRIKQHTDKWYDRELLISRIYLKMYTDFKIKLDTRVYKTIVKNIENIL